MKILLHSSSATASIVEVSLSKFFSVRSGRGSFITDILGIVPNTFREGFIENCRLGSGLSRLLLVLLLLLVKAFLLMGAFDLCLCRDGLVCVLIVGDV